MAILESDSYSDDKIPNFFLDKDDTSNKNPDFQKKLDAENPTNMYNSNYEKKPKKTGQIHIPSVALGAGIAISCLVLGIFLANFIDEDNSPLLEEIPEQKNITFSMLSKNGSPILGDVNAPITLVEFGDYQCTFCKRHFDQTHDLIMKNYVETKKVKILFKDFIVTPGEDSIYAAHAAHCAKGQGMFWKYHYMLYNNWQGESTGWITTKNLNKFAKNIDLDMNKFAKCMSENKWMKLIRASQEDAKALGVTGTPAFFLIGAENEVIRVTGAQPYDVFEQILDSQLEK